MKAVSRHYDLSGTKLKFDGERTFDGLCVERFRSAQMTVCRSVEKQYGVIYLTISFLPLNGQSVEKNEMLMIAERLGLNKDRDYETMCKVSYFSKTDKVFYIFQNTPVSSRRYS